jgi:hypothetical protein
LSAHLVDPSAQFAEIGTNLAGLVVQLRDARMSQRGSSLELRGHLQEIISVQ